MYTIHIYIHIHICGSLYSGKQPSIQYSHKVLSVSDSSFPAFPPTNLYNFSCSIITLPLDTPAFNFNSFKNTHTHRETCALPLTNILSSAKLY